MDERPKLLAIGAALIGALLVARFWGLVVDDAGITFRYAQNLAEGRGLVFNAGERVEGYTNFTWTIALSVVARMGIGLEFAARAMGLMAAACAMAATVSLARSLGGRPSVAALLLAACPALAYWAGAGLETTLFCALWIGSRYQVHRILVGNATGTALVVILVALPLTRPDGVLAVVGALTCGIVVAARLQTVENGARGRWLKIAAATALCGAVYAGWKISYFGDLLPNTYWAKSMPRSVALPIGAKYAASVILAMPVALLALLGAGPGQAAPGHIDDAPALTVGPASTAAVALRRLLIADVLIVLLWSVWVGGDPFAFHRFAVCALPGAAVVASVAARRLRLPDVAIVLLALWMAAGAFVGSGYRRAVTGDRLARIGDDVGVWLDAHLPTDATIAVNAAGFLPWRSDREAIDMLGLTDRTIARTPLADDVGVILAHARSNAPYVLEREPMVVIMGNTSGAAQPIYQSDSELMALPRFASDYVLVTRPLSEIWLERVRLLPEATPLGFYFELPSTMDAEIDEANGLGFLRERLGLLVAVDIVAIDAPVNVWVRREYAHLLRGD